MDDQKTIIISGNADFRKWIYNNIEEPIRPLVILLRDNGYNTVSSCGHEMYVECEYYHESPTALINLLYEYGYHDFKIEIKIHASSIFNFRHECLVIWLPKIDGKYSQFSLHKDNV